MNFIIYEDEFEYESIYRNTISSLMMPTNVNYEIIVINEYNKETELKLKEITGSRIYILDIEVVGKSGLDMAREIRDNGDWISPIIIVTSHDEFKQVGYTGKILMLDFISKKDKIKECLSDTLKVAIKIVSEQKSLKFLNHNEMFQIPYQDILYIEKSLNDNLASIVTNNKEYSIRKTINELESMLENESNFFKSHRSYIINLNNILRIDFEKGVIYFSGSKTALLSRANKKELKSRMVGQ